MFAADPLQVQVIRPGQTYVGQQGFTYGAGASADTVGARHICMNVLPMPPGARAKAHYHERIETIAYMLEGECVVRFGDRMQHEVLVRQGDQAFVPAEHRATRAARHARGWWCTRRGVIRTGS